MGSRLACTACQTLAADAAASSRGRPSGRSWLGRLHRGTNRALIGLIRLYQLTLSPLIGGQCRFHPSCSQYAVQALTSRGALKGSWLTIKRLLKCHPFHPGGIDLPPNSEG